MPALAVVRAAIFTLLFSGTCCPAFAANRAYLDIPLMPLKQALLEFSLQTNMPVVAELDAVERFQSVPLIGLYDAPKAIALLIAKAPLDVNFDSDLGTFLLTPRVHRESLSEPQLLNKPQIEEVLVLARPVAHRYQSVQHSHVKNGVPFFDSSRFHSAISNSFIHDSSSRTLTDLLEQAGGAVRGYGYGQNADDVYLRGFRQKSIYLNGLRLSDRTVFRIPKEIVDKVEVLKGPSMLFYGLSGAGGVINVVPVSPKSQLSAEVEGNNDQSSLSSFFDLNTGRLGLDDSSARLLVKDEAEEDLNRLDAAIFYEQTVSDALSLNIKVWWQNLSVVDDGKSIVLGRTLYTPGENSWARLVESSLAGKVGLLMADVHHIFKDDSQLRIEYMWQEERRTGNLTNDQIVEEESLFSNIERGENFGILTDNATYSYSLSNCLPFQCSQVRNLYLANYHQEYETDVSLGLSWLKQLKVSGVSHRMVAGLDYYYQDIYSLSGITQYDVSGAPVFVDRNSEGSMGLSRFVTMFSLQGIVGEQDLAEYRWLREDAAAYFQVNTRWSDSWLTSVGWRSSWFEGKRTDLADRSQSLVADVNDISPQIGLTFQPYDGLSLFINYSESTTIRYLIDDSDNFATRPLVARQWESGGKYLSGGGRVSASLALFDINQGNLRELELVDGRRRLSQPYRVNSRGAEINVSVQVDNSLQLSTHCTRVITTENYDAASIIAPIVPELTCGAMASWSSDGRLRFTLGGYGVSDRLLGGGLTTKVDGYTKWDIGAIYSFRTSAFSGSVRLDYTGLSDHRYIAYAENHRSPVWGEEALRAAIHLQF